MKSIKVKSYNKLMENIITEDGIKLDGDTNSWNGKLKKRIVDAIRLSKECKAAAEIARQNGKDEDAAWLDQRATDYEEAAAHWNQDIINNDEEEQSNNVDSNKDKKEATATDRAAQAASDANYAAAQAKNAAKDAQQKADEQAANGQDNSEAQQKADQAKEAAEKAEQAAEQAKEAAESAQKAEKQGDKGAAESEADKAEEAAKNAEEAANQAKEASGTKDNSEKNSEGSQKDTRNNTDTNTDNAQGGPENQNQSKDDQNNSSGSENNSSNSEDSSGEGSEKQDSKKSNSEDSNSNNNDESESDDNESEEDNENANGNGSSETGSGNDDSEDSESNSNDPVNDPFADDEDIPQLNISSPNGKEPRDATLDDIIKQLSNLEGEAKRGAIDGLTDLVSGKKNESLSEAFKKGIRDFSDEEWDDMSDETIDRIEKVKKIDTIDDVEGIKADFKDWSENPVLRQELEDEEKQNIQHDILQRRENEKELEKYGKLETLKDFELDFENCIRDQVTMVMKDYQDYSEINPEYEDEDIIMKADVQKIIPSEELPSIAVFFDQSQSWDSRDIAKGQKAIATVKQKYVDTGLCTLDIWYFADRVGRHNYGIGGGTTAWPYIVKTIAQYDYKNVIIMTDDDMNEWNNHGESYTVEGCVWWIWRDGRRAANLPKQVKGMQHNFECEFH